MNQTNKSRVKGYGIWGKACPTQCGFLKQYGQGGQQDQRDVPSEITNHVTVMGLERTRRLKSTLCVGRDTPGLGDEGSVKRANQHQKLLELNKEKGLQIYRVI